MIEGLSTTPMLSVDVSKIPPEGLDIDEALEPGEVHVEGEEDFVLEEGGHLTCHLELADNRTVHVRGHLGALLDLTCNRCLVSFPFKVGQDLELFYLPHKDGEEEEEDEVQLSDRDMVVAYYQGEQLDLGEIVREQFFLTVPLKRLCREDCLGLCPTCGANRNLNPCQCPPEAKNTHLAGLGKIFDKGSS
jgi:uncharacterized protein